MTHSGSPAQEQEASPRAYNTMYLFVNAPPQPHRRHTHTSNWSAIFSPLLESSLDLYILREIMEGAISLGQ